LGWDTKDSLISFCRGLLQAGADALAIHGRRFVDKYQGIADWEPIYALKRAFPEVPIIGNGDIRCAADALHMIGNLDGVMVGRATMGNPWILSDIGEAFRTMKEACHGEPFVPQDELRRTMACAELSQFDYAHCDNSVVNVPTVERLSLTEKIPFILEHCRLAIEVKGEERGMREMRRHLALYVKGFPGAAELRARLVRVEKMTEVEEILRNV